MTGLLSGRLIFVVHSDGYILMEFSRHKHFYLLPNAITTSSLFMGIVAYVQIIHSNFRLASLAIMACVILDGLDGRIARLTKTSTPFGGQFDSLTDMLTFGFFPGALVSSWFFSITSISSTSFIGKAIWLCVFFHALAVAYRLALFNCTFAEAEAQKSFFRGLPCPAAALLLVSWVFLMGELGTQTKPAAWTAIGGMLMVSLLMVAKYAYFSFKEFPIRHGRRALALFIVALILGFIYVAFAETLLIFALVYVLSGPTIYHLRPIRKFFWQ